jgi:dinuclear metal center YbgI/SA1388 family protein
MKRAKVSDILGIINKIAPHALSESWDNAGLQVGDPTAEVSRVMVALDATSAVINSALSHTCQMLVTHHPLIFKPQKSISTATSQGQLIHTAIGGGLAIASMHTNYDIADGGLNDVLAQRLGINCCAPIQITARQELVKLVVFVPEDHLEQVRSALFPFTQNLGAYHDCSFAAPGEGTFTPRHDATPYIGVPGRQERIRERRLEVLVDRLNLSRAVKALAVTHPYEEPAFDIYPLLNEGCTLGLGRLGRLSEPVSLEKFASLTGRLLNVPCLRYVGDSARLVSKVALCSGAGSSVMRAAARAGADVLVTGDVKYHETRETEDLGMALIDAGHFHTEIIMVDAVTARLSDLLAAEGFLKCEAVPCRIETDPFRYVQQC